MLTAKLKYDKSIKFSRAYAYHATHGIRLASIQKYGLITDMVGIQYENREVFFHIDANDTYRVYGEDVMLRVARKFGNRIADWYYQGPCLLRCEISFLIKQGYALGASDYSGDKNIPASLLDIFYENKWILLSNAKLEHRSCFSVALHKLLARNFF